MKQDEFGEYMDAVFEDEIKLLREQGQKEYAHEGNDTFANFDRVADHLGMDRKKVLLVYLLKHIDGISSWVQGEEAHREDITGRIDDAITYLFLLRGMVSEERGEVECYLSGKNHD